MLFIVGSIRKHTHPLCGQYCGMQAGCTTGYCWAARSSFNIKWGGWRGRELDCYSAGPEVTTAGGSLLHQHHHHHHINPLLCLRPLHNVRLRNVSSLMGGSLQGVKRLGLEAD